VFCSFEFGRFAVRLEAKIGEIFSSSFLSLSRGARSSELLVATGFIGRLVLGAVVHPDREKYSGGLDWNWGISLRFLLEPSTAAVAIGLRLVD
jgi:hypothetical protein